MSGRGWGDEIEQIRRRFRALLRECDLLPVPPARGVGSPYPRVRWPP